MEIHAEHRQLVSDEERREIAVTIARPFHEVDDFLGERSQWPTWAAGLATGIERAGSDWIVQQGGGTARLRFLSDEPGCHDHVVSLAGGHEVHVPLRAVPSGAGSEVVLTLIRQPAMSDAEFARDAEWVRRDLETLKRLLEGR